MTREVNIILVSDFPEIKSMAELANKTFLEIIKRTPSSKINFQSLIALLKELLRVEKNVNSIKLLKNNRKPFLKLLCG